MVTWRNCKPHQNMMMQEGLRHVVRFVEWFQEPGRDLWLVFRDEGVSLHALMYNHVALGAEHDAGDPYADEHIKDHGNPQLICLRSQTISASRLPVVTGCLLCVGSEIVAVPTLCAQYQHHAQ